MDVRSMALLAWRQQLFGSVGGALVEAALTVIGASRVRRAAALDDRIAGKAGVAGGLLGCPTPNGDGLCGCANAACAERDVPPLDWLPTAVPGLDAVSDLLGSLVVMGPARSAAAAADGGGVGAPSATLPLLSRLRAIDLRDPNVAVVPASVAAGASERRGPGTMWACPAWASQARAPPLPGLPVAVGDMELYRSAFERKFLDSTTAYFTAESARLLGRLPSPVTYVWAVETVVRRAELAASVGVYTAAETTPRLAKALDGALVGAHAPRLTGLVPALLLDGRSADLRTLHALLVRLPAGSLRPVQDCLRSVVHAAGTAAVAPHLPGVRPPPPPPPPSTTGGTGASGSVALAATPAATDGDVYHDAVGVAATEEEEVGVRATAFVSAAWGVYKRYAGVVASAFGADAAFTDALDRGCARFLNAADSAAPITLALYCHAVLSGAVGGRGGDGGAVDGDLLGPWVGHTRAAAADPADPVEEAALVRYRLACVTRLFRFVDDKSAFLAEYATCLARRLVVASAPAVSNVAACPSAAAVMPVGGGGWRMDAERAMLGDLRDTVGPAYTSPLLRMLADLDVSRDENASFMQVRGRGRSSPGGGDPPPPPRRFLCWSSPPGPGHCHHRRHCRSSAAAVAGGWERQRHGWWTEQRAGQRIGRRALFPARLRAARFVCGGVDDGGCARPVSDAPPASRARCVRVVGEALPDHPRGAAVDLAPCAGYRRRGVVWGDGRHRWFRTRAIAVAASVAACACDRYDDADTRASDFDDDSRPGGGAAPL
ncbi:hypothetical protein BU14_0640s0004 [Porphyra umbilicalis]|uniref:Cullin family profile domain-containing protein n=1 Tax=Porphyra umbilicalis TaxID=2786 RepID=A0A1X6NQJ6_PORUM|nr:hypothetical protein BU14_0640s0004 [Porphyra umbilicalis]|eukprot:OSX70899.1 hypothetical protein BU14_0640s0004 [Porphyra umbilicalis]